MQSVRGQYLIFSHHLLPTSQPRHAATVNVIKHATVVIRQRGDADDTWATGALLRHPFWGAKIFGVPRSLGYPDLQDAQIFGTPRLLERPHLQGADFLGRPDLLGCPDIRGGQNSIRPRRLERPGLQGTKNFGAPQCLGRSGSGRPDFEAPQVIRAPR